LIAFAVSVTEGEAYRRYAEPGIERAKEADSEVYVFAEVGQALRTYNLLLDTAAKHEDLEALVLVHPHTEIREPGFCGRVREALADPSVAVVGAIGAKGVRTIAWWEGEISAGPVIQAYHEFGGGEVIPYSWKERVPAGAEVDVVGGMLMILSPWAVRNVRFDERLALGHGYDFDYCTQVRAAGRKVRTADLAITHHQSLELVEDPLCWIEAHRAVAEKWEGRRPGAEAGHEEPTEAEWKRRARRAEAERELARAIAYGSELTLDARVSAVGRELERTEGSLSWRLTEPLRRVNYWRRQRLNGGGAGPPASNRPGPGGSRTW
jgi:Glycosyltransferase like family